MCIIDERWKQDRIHVDKLDDTLPYKIITSLLYYWSNIGVYVTNARQLGGIYICVHILV